MKTQIAIKLPEELVAAVDRLVDEGHYESRSDAVRTGIGMVVRKADRQRVDRAFAQGFARTPESAGELADARRLAIEAIEDEPWEPWW
jgi:Arc/MetJ-type ribon-helix-helix transcriptional regulator